MAAKLTSAGLIRPDVNIPAQKLPSDLMIGDFLDVLVGEVFSPGRFYVQVFRTSCVIILVLVVFSGSRHFPMTWMTWWTR